MKISTKVDEICKIVCEFFKNTAFRENQILIFQILIFNSKINIPNHIIYH